MLSYFTALAYRRAALIRNMIAPPRTKKAENANLFIFYPITMSTTITAPMRPPSNINPGALWSALAIVVIGAWYLGQAVGPRQAALYVVGALLGVTLYHAAFGFTSAWRVFIADGRGEGLRAQMVMLAVGVALFFPVLAAGSLFGAPVKGLVAPAGTSGWRWSG